MARGDANAAPGWLRTALLRTKRWLLIVIGWIARALGIDLCAVGTAEELLTPYTSSLVFGNEDREQEERPYRLLVEGWRRDGALSLPGRKLVASALQACIAMRSQLELAMRNRNGSTGREVLSRPLFIVGWPRTGTTLLHKLMNECACFRAPLLWELLNPFMLEQESQAVAGTEDMLAFFFDTYPEFRAIHSMEPREADECCHVLEYMFVDRHAPVIGQTQHEYASWLYSRGRVEMENVYRRYKVVLESIASHQDTALAPPTMVMKDNIHMLFLDALLEVFSDANVVCTYRDPVAVLGSNCSGFSVLSRFYYAEGDVDQRALALRAERHLNECANAMMRVQTDPRYDRHFLNVCYNDLIEDPIAVVERIAHRFDYTLGEDDYSSMQTYLQEHSRTRHGAHRYDVATWGFNAADVRRKYERYEVHMTTHFQ